MKKVRIYLLLVSLIAVWSCQKEDNLRPRGQRPNASLPGANELAGKKTSFTVRIENITTEGFVTPFAPGLWIVQKKNSNVLFREGYQDFGQGLEAIAEDGDPSSLFSNLARHPKVRSRGVFNTPVGAGGPAPIFPGEAYEFSIQGKPNDYLNFATMFIQSNDLFVGPDAQGIALFDRHGTPTEGDITSLVDLWDAGTEINEEPGEGPNQAPRQSGPNTGPSEGGVVQIVNDQFSYPALEDIIRITITPN